MTNEFVLDILGNWAKMNNLLHTMTEDQLKSVINYECSTKRRKVFVERLHQRYAKLHAARQRQELINGETML